LTGIITPVVSTRGVLIVPNAGKNRSVDIQLLSVAREDVMVEFAISKVRGYLNCYAISGKIIVKNDVALGRL
jgi:hypothetical protein